MDERVEARVKYVMAEVSKILGDCPNPKVTAYEAKESLFDQSIRETFNIEFNGASLMVWVTLPTKAPAEVSRAELLVDEHEQGITG